MDRKSMILEWIGKMQDAGWSFWLFIQPGIMWQHTEGPVNLSIKESGELFHLYTKIGTIFNAEEIQAWKDVGWNPEEK